MQVDRSHRCAHGARSRSGPWHAVGTRFALLPLALGLLAAGLLGACTISTATPGGRAAPLHATPSRALADPSALRPAPAPVAVRLVPATMTHAEQGDVDAMYRLALMHETGGGGMAQDRSEMLRWLALASKLGHGPASYKLFMHYDDQPSGSARAQRFKELAERQGYYGPSSTSSRR